MLLSLSLVLADYFKVMGHDDLYLCLDGTTVKLASSLYATSFERKQNFAKFKHKMALLPEDHRNMTIGFGFTDESRPTIIP